MMKLKWDQSYLKIALYVVLTLVSTYILFKVVDSLAYILTNAEKIGAAVSGGIGKVFSVCSVLVIAAVIAYLLDPLADFFQRRFDELHERKIKPYLKRRLKPMPAIRRVILIRAKKQKPRRFQKRTAGAAITYLLFFSGIGLLIFFLVVRIRSGGQTSTDITRNIMNSIDRTANDLSEFYAGAVYTLELWGVSDYISDAVSEVYTATKDLLGGISKDIMPTLTSAGSSIFDFFMGIVVAFYFIVDKEAIAYRANELCDTFLPEKFGRQLKDVLEDVHVVFSGYIRGQLTDAAIMGCLLSLGLSLVGVDFAILIGMFSGFANIIPYFGAFVGFVLSVFVALLSGEPMQALYAAVVVIVLQQIDGVLIAPKIVGEKVELSPALVLLSLSIFGSMFGLPGMVFAVPLCAVIKIFLTRFMTRYKEKTLGAAHTRPLS